MRSNHRYVWESKLAVDVDNIHAASLPYRTPEGSISLHLGYPDPMTFPALEIAEVTSTVLSQDYRNALQYCGEQGDAIFRAAIAETYRHIPKTITERNIIITQGTTDALEILPQLLLSNGDIVLMEAPTYLWAIRSFGARHAKMIGIPIDNEGIRTDLLRGRLLELSKANIVPKYLYVMPDFQNPSGYSMSLRRRVELLSIALEFGILIVEDSPYIELRYEGDRLPPLFEMDDHNLVVLMQSFSKTIGPGIRLGWIVGPEAFVEKIVRMKQTGACTLLSRAISLYIQTIDYARNLDRVRSIYKGKCETMARALKKYCPDDVHWTQPYGGFYFWLNLPDRIDVRNLYEKAFSRKLIFLSGYDFFCDVTQWKSLRLSFSYESEENISKGISILGELLAETY